MSKYEHYCKTPSDINQHLPVLLRYALQAEHITEMGVRAVVSTYAFIEGEPKKLHCYDLERSENMKAAQDLAAKRGVWLEYHIADVLKVEIEATELLFIDTLHNYDQLKQELELHADKASKWIILHDTTTFGESGETKPKGLWPAVEEFLIANPHWQIKERLVNNNGLTVLERQ